VSGNSTSVIVMMNRSPTKPSAWTTAGPEPEATSSIAVLANNNNKNKKDDTDDRKPTTTVSTMDQIQSECSFLISALRKLEQEENDLQCQLDFLSREALLCGFQADKVEKVLLRKPSTKRKADGAASSKRTTSAATVIFGSAAGAASGAPTQKKNKESQKALYE
jgi:hypothetical protein